MIPAGEQNWLPILLAMIWIIVQFGLAGRALHDLWRRPRVRGNNKLAWALLILIVPIAGPLLYSSFGPTSFRPRAHRPQPPAGDANGPRPSART